MSAEEEYLGANGASTPLRASLACEQSTLGSLLIGADWRSAAMLTPADFARPDHAVIFGAMMALANADVAIDVTTVTEQLAIMERLDDAGGQSYLIKLAADTPSGENLATYARAVRDRSDARATIGAINDALDDAQGLDSQHILGALEQRLDPLRRRLSWRKPQRPVLDWKALEGQPVPERQWIIDHWLPAGHPVLFAGSPGTGKTMVSQALASCIALRREYLDWPATERRVLMWAAEDDAGELHRRHVAIAKWLGVKLSDFDRRLMLLSYDRVEVELAALIDQRLVETPMMKELREQIGDYQADVVFLDSIARVYGGNENDRHQVSQFMAMLSRAGDSTGAAIVLVGHPGKAAGSEYSGSTAWEGAVRARLFLGRTLPDARPDQSDEPAEDDGVRYLARRKANYSPRDWRRLTYRDGVMVPDAPPDMRRGTATASPDYARDVVRRAVQKLATMGHYGVSGRNSSNFLPSLARTYQLLDGVTERDFTQTMRAMEKDGTLVKTVVGMYPNRTKREGLALAQ